MRLLIEAGSIISTADATGMTALKMAQKHHHDHITAMLEATS